MSYDLTVQVAAQKAEESPSSVGYEVCEERPSAPMLTTDTWAAD